MHRFISLRGTFGPIPLGLVLFGAVVLGVPIPVPAAEVLHSGEVAVRLASSSRATQQLEGEVILRASRSVGRSCEAHSEIRLRVDETDRLEPSRPRELSARSKVSQRAFLGDRSEAELREAKLSCTFQRGFLTVGKQQTVWGEADGLKVLDVVNPQSFRELLAEDFDDSRIPLWTVNVDLQLGGFTELQVLWIPDATVHQFPEDRDGRTAVFELTSPLYRPEAAASALLDGRLAVPESAAGLSLSSLGLDPGDPFLAALERLGVTELGLDDLRALGLESRIATDRSTRPKGGSDWGLRLKSRAGDWDFALYRLRHLDPVPLFARSVRVAQDPDTTAPLLSVDFEQIFQRVDLYGFSFNNAFGPFVLRGELGWTPDKHVQVVDLVNDTGLARADETALVLGLDWQRGTTLVSGQLFHTSLRGLAGTALRGESEETATALVQHLFGDSSEHLVRLLWVHGLERDDGWVQLKLGYEIAPATDLEASIDAYYGDELGFWGQFNGRDRLGIALRTSW